MSKNNTILGYGSTKKHPSETKEVKKKITSEQSQRLLKMHNQQISNEQPIKSCKRLRKMIEIEKDSQENTRKIISPLQSQQESFHQQHIPQRFAMMDNEEIQAQNQLKSTKVNKKTPKNNTHLEDYVNKVSSNKKPAQKIIKKQNTQLLLSQSFKNNALRKKRKNSDDSIPIADDQDDQDSLILRQKAKNARKQNINGDLTQQQAMKLALLQSLQNQTNKDNIDDYAFKPSNSISNKVEIKPIQKIQKQIRKHQKKAPEKVTTQKRKKSASKEKDDKPQGPFSGQTIFTTGQFQPYNKIQIIQLLKKLGADCPSSAQLPKKATVNFLLVGLYCVDTYGRRLNAKDVTTTKKYQQAVAKNVPIILNYDLDDFFQKHCGKTLTEYIEGDRKIAQQSRIQLKKVQQTNQQKLLKINEPKTAQKMQQNNEIFIPWTDKYKPNGISQVIGQQSQIKSLQEWLQAWEDIHLRGNKRQVKSKGMSGDINSSAALISGDPGLGKTTTAKLIAAHLGYNAIEFNASDVRNKSNVGMLESNSYSLECGVLQKRLIIMDQIDGMSGGDRGGSTAIIQMIKTTKIPIICVCNDRQSEKIRSLANYCLDVRFHKPDKRLITKRLMNIILNEKARADERALERIVQIFQNDIRKILTYLQIVVRTQTKHITLDTIERGSQSKDSTVMINHFQATRRLMNMNGMNLRQKLDTFFIDSDLMPLMTFENYLGSCRKNMRKQDFHRLVEANDSFVIGDILDKKIRKEQEWGLMPSFGIMCCVYPIYKVSAGTGQIGFPAFLGKFSSERKNRRLMRELKYAIGPNITGGSKAVKSQYSTMLFKRINNELKKDNVEGVLDFMQAYNITPAILNEHLVSLQYNPGKLNLLADISTQTKTKLTKGFNKRHQATKIKTLKGKVKNQHQKFNPILQEIQKEELDEEDQDQEEQVVIEAKKNNKKK